MPEIISRSLAAQRSLQASIRPSRIFRPPLHYPRVCQSCMNRRYGSGAAAVQTSSVEYEVEAPSESPSNAPTRRPLSPQQRQFLDSAVCGGLSLKLSNPSPNFDIAPRQSSRRIGSCLDLCRPEPRPRPQASKSEVFDATHV